MVSRLTLLAALAAALAALAPSHAEADERVRIELADSDEIVEGRLVEHADRGFVIQVGDEQRVVPFASVKKLSVVKQEPEPGAPPRTDSAPAPIAEPVVAPAAEPAPETQPSRLASADEAPASEATDPDFANAVSADIVRLIGSFALVSYERRLHERFGVALLAGVGGSDEMGSGGRGIRDSWGVGMQARAYPVGSFRHGMSAGVEGYYWSGDGWDGLSPAIGGGDPSTSTLVRKMVGPFLGYRRISAIGLLVDATLGLSRDLETDDWRTSIHVNAGFAF